MRPFIIATLFAAFAGAACAHGMPPESKASKVTDVDVGRLEPEERGVIDKARHALDQARDEHSQQLLAVQEAKAEEQKAIADVRSAEARQAAADVLERTAGQSRDPTELREASEEQERARAEWRAADARLVYTRNLIAAREADVKRTEQEVALAESKVELSKLRALQRANNPAAAKYDLGRFMTAINEKQIRLEQLEKQSRALDQDATAARQVWKTFERQAK